MLMTNFPSMGGCSARRDEVSLPLPLPPNTALRGYIRTCVHVMSPCVHTRLCLNTSRTILLKYTYSYVDVHVGHLFHREVSVYSMFNVIDAAIPRLTDYLYTCTVCIRIHLCTVCMYVHSNTFPQVALVCSGISMETDGPCEGLFTRLTHPYTCSHSLCLPIWFNI